MRQIGLTSSGISICLYSQLSTDSAKAYELVKSSARPTLTPIVVRKKRPVRAAAPAFKFEEEHAWQVAI